MSNPSQTTQAVTPELRSWIIDQAKNGCKPETLLKSMVDAGWHEDVALDAMQETLEAHLKGLPMGLPPKQGAGPDLQPAQHLPTIDLSQNPLYLDGGDRQVQVLAALEQPRVVVLGNLLSDEECADLIALARPKLKRSLTVDNATGGEELNADRTSNGMFFHRGENDLVTRIEARLARLVQWPVINGEGLQILQYGPGAEYKPHYDYFDPNAPGSPTILARGGQRLATVVMYLSEPEAGGGTVFPDVKFSVSPKRGHAVFFSYPVAHPSSQSLHGGAPVITGEKWIATKWLREREFV